jgi:TP901 family phage tail tape measure protein
MAASSGAIRAGAAYVEMLLENKQFLSGLAAVQQRLRSASASFRAAGDGLMRFSAVALAPIAMATKVFASFDDQMRAVKAVTGATAGEFQRLYDLGKELGRTTSFTAAEVAGGQLELGRAGFKPAEIEAATGSVLALARATGVNLAESAGIAAGTLRAFNLSADQMGRVSDVLVATANNSAQTLTDLGESMKYVAPIAAEYGMSLEDTAKAIGVLANMQIKGSMAGTGLRKAILSLSDPGTRKGLAAMGVDLSTFGSAMIGVGRVMASMPGPERLAFASGIFGEKAAAAAVKLAKSDFPALGAAIDNAAGVAQRTSDEMDSGIGGTLRRLWSAVEGTAIALGEALSGAISNAAETLSSFNASLTEWLGRNGELAVSVTALLVGTVALGLGLRVVGAALAGLSVIATGARVAIQALKVAFTFLAANPLAATFLISTVAIVALGMAFSTAGAQADEFSTAAATALATGDKQRAAAMGQMAELDRLSQKNRLNNEEQARAKKIIQELSDSYGNLGIRLDATTGRLSGVAEAQARVNTMMKAQAATAVDSAMAESMERAAKAKERIDTGVNLSSALSVAVGMAPDEVAAAEKRLADEEALQARLRKRLEDINAGAAGALTGGEKPGGPSAEESAAKAADVAAKAQIDQAHKLASIRIGLIKDQYDRERAAIDEKWAYEIAKAKEAGEETASLETLRDAELDAARVKMERSSAEENAKARKKASEDAAAAEKKRADDNRQLQDDVIRAEIEAAGLPENEKQRALLDLSQRREREQAAAAGLDMDLVSRKQAAEQDALQRQQTIKDGAAAAEQKIGTAGTFSAFAAARMGAGGGAQERAAKAAEAALPLLREIAGGIPDAVGTFTA